MDKPTVKTLSIKGNVYQVSEAYANNCLKLARESFSKKDKAIYAIEKNNVLMMLNEVFSSSLDLTNAISGFTSQGFKVYSTIKKIKSDVCPSSTKRESFMETFRDCNKCPQISITEEQQKHDSKVNHICKRTGKRIYHHGKQPILPTPNDCIFSEYYKNI